MLVAKDILYKNFLMECLLAKGSDHIKLHNIKCLPYMLELSITHMLQNSEIGCTEVSLRDLQSNNNIIKVV